MEEEDGKNGRGSRNLSESGTKEDIVGNEIVTQYMALWNGLLVFDL